MSAPQAAAHDRAPPRDRPSLVARTAGAIIIGAPLAKTAPPGFATRGRAMSASKHRLDPIDERRSLVDVGTAARSTALATSIARLPSKQKAWLERVHLIERTVNDALQKTRSGVSVRSAVHRSLPPSSIYICRRVAESASTSVFAPSVASREAVHVTQRSQRPNVQFFQSKAAMSKAATDDRRIWHRAPDRSRPAVDRGHPASIAKRSQRQRIHARCLPLRSRTRECTAGGAHGAPSQRR